MYIYIAYDRKYPYLPIAVADSARELGRLVGTTKSCIHSAIFRYEQGALQRSCYQRVNIQQSGGAAND